VSTVSSTSTSQSTSIPDFARPAPAPRSPGSAPESDPSRPFSLPGAGGVPINPLEIGRSDLEPLGGNIRNPFAPPSLFGGVSGGFGGDGMYVGPSHPMFRDRMDPSVSAGGGVGGRTGPWGGDGFLPPIGAPPGARFDPVGPFGPGGGPSPGFPGTGGPRRGFGPGAGGASGPDNDEFMPPGFVRRLSHFHTVIDCSHYPRRAICIAERFQHRPDRLSGTS
jgi:proteasome inhibitor subunit 1 (PI31)